MAPVSDLDPIVPAKHPAVELLVDYAAGAMFEAEALTIALHLDACPSCRQAADLALATGGALLNEIDPAYVPLALLQVTLQEIDEHAPAVTAGKLAGTVPAYARQWPARLRAHLAGRWPRRWRLMPAGFRGLRIPTEGDAARLWMIKMPGGKGPPRHRHREVEWTLVVEGGFTDESGTYAPGDFCYMGKGDIHSMMADPEGCTCLIVTRINPEYLTLKGKLAAPLIKL
jgi:putative transcriptional regulator